MPPNRAVLAVVTAIAIVAALVGAFGFYSSFTRTEAGVITVVRNGGMFDNRQLRMVDGKPQVLPPGSSLTSVGWYSTTHAYPASQRWFKVSSRPDADSNEVINVPTKDGVLVGVEGTFYFTLNTDPMVLGQFDDKYGTRTYPAPVDGDSSRRLHAWEEDDGWSAFLNASLGNLVQNDLRREVSKVTCTDLISSCALAQNSTGQDPAAVIAAAQAGEGGDKITAIQDSVNAQVAADVAKDLGGPYFTDIHFVISKVAPPDNVQQAINDAQAAFAGVTKAQAGKAAAEIDAQTNQVRQNGYNACPTCADIDRLKALPPGLTTYAPGGNYAVTGR